MTPLALILAAGLAAEPGLTVGTPRASATGFELPVDAPVRALKKVERHAKNHRLVLFVPGVAGAATSQVVELGPVSLVKVVPAERGVAITLQLRGEGSLDRLVVELEPSPVVRYGDAVLAALPPPPVETMPAARPAPVETAPAPRLVSSPVLLASTTSGGSSTRTTVLAVTLLLVVAAAAAATFAQRRRNHEKSVGETIDVVAVRSFGAKQKLVLVNTCGDRLLLATCDKEVRLLKNLGPAGSTDAGFAAALAAADDQVTAAGSADIAGLLKLRARRTDGAANDEATA